MSKVTEAVVGEREAARQRVIDAAVLWRTKTHVHEWTASCQALMEAVDGLSILEARGP